jgi:hypothetical protein
MKNDQQPGARPSSGAIDNAAQDADSSFSSDPVGSVSLTCPASGHVLTAPLTPEKKHWIQIELVDEHGKPLPGEDYRITLPDGSIVEGTLDSRGRERINGIDSGNCKVSFPDLDEDVWDKK